MSALPLILLSAVAETIAVLRLFPQGLLKSPPLILFFQFTQVNLILYALYWSEIWPRVLSPLRHLPKPGGALPIFGHSHFIFDQPIYRRMLEWVSNIPNDGLILWRGFGYREILLVTSPKALAEVLVTRVYDFEKPGKLKRFFGRLFGTSVVLAEGQDHAFQRKNMAPSFHFRNLKELYPMMWGKSVFFTKVLASEINSQSAQSTGEKGPTSVVEIGQWSTKATIDIIGIAALGRELHTLEGNNDELVSTFMDYFEPSFENMMYCIAMLSGPQDLISRLPLHMNRRLDAMISKLRRLTTELVQAKRRAVSEDPQGHIDLLACLIKSGNFSDTALVNQLLTFLAAGHETTSSAFEWIALELALHPDWQTKLRRELREHMTLDCNALAGDQIANILENLPTLNGVCEETLRFHPPKGILLREAVRSTFINGVSVPAGTGIMLSPWATNRDPDLWTDADKFMPERWIGEDGRPNKSGGATSNFSMLTFLHGPRNCLGAQFTRQELRCLLAAFTLAFEWELAYPDEEIKVAGVVATKPVGGLYFRVRRSF